MSLIQSIILGIVQGLTEFLPISSSAHLTLVPIFLKWQDPGLAYDVALHLGTLTAILIAFWKDWLDVIRQALHKLGIKHNHNEHATVDFRWIILGSFPAAIAGLLLEKQAENTFRSPLIIAITLATFGIVLGLADRSGKKTRPLLGIKLKEAMIIGCAQAMAIIPGVSRSGITITAALLLGFTRPAALRFSFLLSAPIIAGAGMVKIKHILALISNGGTEAQAVFVGFLASLFSGLIAIFFLNKLITTKSFSPFVYYRVALALFITIVIIFR